MKLPETWTLIAESQYNGTHGVGFSKWVSVDDAILGVKEARKMHDDGCLLMAQKRLASGRMGLVIKAKGK